MKVLELFLNKFNIEIKQNESVIGNFSYILWDNNRYKICGSGNYENEIKDFSTLYQLHLLFLRYPSTRLLHS